MARHLVLLLCCFIAAANAQSGSGSGSGSASGSGSGADCTSAGCSYDCMETPMGPMCTCPIGERVNSENLVSCERCPGGTWGTNCAEQCTCGQGNNCDNINGNCLCNLCWSGTNCNTPDGPDCLKEFLTIPNKITDEISDRYGGAEIPQIPVDTIESLWVDLLGSNADVIDNAAVETVDRTGVNQGPLAKLTCTLDFTVDRPEVERALENIRSAIKLGTYRATLVTQELANVAEVTINAGTSYP